MNIYAFTGNDPINGFDVLGLNGPDQPVVDTPPRTFPDPWANGPLSAPPPRLFYWLSLTDSLDAKTELLERNAAHSKATAYSSDQAYDQSLISDLIEDLRIYTPEEMERNIFRPSGNEGGDAPNSGLVNYFRPDGIGTPRSKTSDWARGESDDLLSDVVLVSDGIQGLYKSGAWVQVMIDKWGKDRVLFFLRAYLAEYKARREAHSLAAQALGPTSTLDDMAAEVNKHRPGTYITRKSANNTNVRTGDIKLSDYVSSSNLNADMNSFLNHHLGVVHENVHADDVRVKNSVYGSDNRVGSNGQWAAGSEVFAYEANIRQLEQAIQHAQNQP